jgi:MFS family permease
VFAMLLAWPMGYLCDRFDRRRITVLIALGAALTAGLAMLLATNSMQALTLLSGFYVGLVAALYPVSVAVTNDRMPVHHIVPASATLLLSYGLGSALGPLLSTSLMQWLGSSGFYITSILVLLCFVTYLRIRIAHTRDIPVEEQEAFVTNLPEGTAVINELDPRNTDFTEVPVSELFPDLAEQATTVPADTAIDQQTDVDSEQSVDTARSSVQQDKP